MVPEREKATKILEPADVAQQVFAEELYISHYTVETHVSSILRKLGLMSRREIS